MPAEPAAGPDDIPEHDQHRFLDELREAAIEAEFATGEREDTVEEAQSSVIVRLARMTGGFLLLIVGIIMLPLPGPGWLVIAAALTILAKDIAWADRALRFVRRKVPGIPEDGKIPRSTILVGAVLTLAAVAISLWWTTLR